MPDAKLRGLVLVSGALLGVTGLLIIASLPLSGIGRWLAMLAWLGYSLVELGLSAHAYREVLSYRLFADGSLQIERRRGRFEIARCGPGSVILADLAWLRVTAANGASWGELLGRDRRNPGAWRRFQVICRHRGA